MFTDRKPRPLSGAAAKSHHQKMQAMLNQAASAER